MTRVSVVVPTCDREDSLALALSSISEQTQPADQVFVVDNGRDRVSDSLRKRFEFAQFLRLPPRSGVSVARNYGVMAADGSWVAFLDDDDVWAPNYLERMLQAAQSQDLDLVAAARELATGDVVHPVPVIKHGVVPAWRKTGYAGSNVVVKRAAFLAVGGYPSDLKTGEDRALFVESVTQGFRVGVCDDTWVRATAHHGQRLTDDGTLLRGKLDFLSRYGDMMDRRSAREDRFAFLVYLSRDWRFPFWIIGCIAYPEVAARRLLRKVC